jgi:hypothetical protein
MRFPQRQQVEDIQAGCKVLDLVNVANGEALDERSFEVEWKQRVCLHRLAVCKLQRPVRQTAGYFRFLASGRDADRPARGEVNGNKRVRVGGETQFRPGAWEFDDQRTAFDGRDASDSQLRVEAMGEVVPFYPGATRVSAP